MICLTAGSVVSAFNDELTNLKWFQALWNMVVDVD